MRKPNLGRSTLFLSGLILITVTGCSTSLSVVKRDPFANPTSFESLASGAHEAPAPVAALPEPVIPSLASPPLAATPLVTAPSVPAVSDVEVSSPDLAYSTLVRGNERFVTGAVRGEHRDQERRRALASGQKPHTIVLSCSDSRVPPELIFDQGLGDIFTVRVAGNILGSAQVASIEYAIEHLGAKLVVVMGHESCGAVKAALGSGGGHGGAHASAGSTDLDWLVSSIKPNLSARGIASVDSSADPKLRKPVMANIDAVTEQLLVRSKILSEAIAHGKVKVVRGIYGLESGRVDFWGYR